MAKIKVAIYDTDKGYRERFTDYLMSYKASEMELAVFTGEEFFYEALCVDKFQLLVLGCGYEEVLLRAKAQHVPILILTEYVESYVKESVGMLDEQISYTSKYQSMDLITQKMQLMTESNRRYGEIGTSYRELEVVGVFSPIRHEMQMLFSLLYAKNAAREKKVLYINLLEFSGFSEIFGDAEYDLGDAILEIREPSVRIEHLLSCIYESDAFSYISPFANPQNMREITAEDVAGLLKVIEEQLDYGMVILDIGTNIGDFTEVLLACSKLYCIGKKGFLYETQVRQFLLYMERTVDAAFLERMKQLELPGQTRVICGGLSLLEQLDWGEFGDYVRSVL